MKKDINAVYDTELMELLQKLNLLEKLNSGQLKCKFTDTIITLDNLHSIFPESGDIKVVSNKPEAVKMLSKYINDHGL